MKLIETLVDLIVEAAPEEIYKKYYSDIERPEFIRIISLDPATKIDGEKIKKIGRYAKLLLKMFKSGDLKTEDFPKAKDYLSLVYKHQVPVDMNKIKTLGDLFGLVEKYYSRDENQNVFDLVNVLSENDYELLLSGEKWIIYRPISEKGAAYLGVGTEWCTAWGPYSTNEKYKDRQNHFSHHNAKGWLYVIINREKPEEKYQFHFETKQFMDRNDRKIDTGDFFDRQWDVTKYFFPSLFDDTPVDDEETKRMDRLSSPLKAKLIDRIVGETDNELVSDLINMDGDELVEKLKSTYITDPELKSLEFEYLNREINSETLKFEMDVRDDLQLVAQTLNSYEAGSGYSAYHSEWLRDDITNGGDEDWLMELIEPLLKEYFDGGNVTYTDDYEEWKTFLLDNYYDSLVGDFADEYAELNEPLVETSHEVEANKIKQLIIPSEDGYVEITPANMALFIHREKLTRLDDLYSFFEAYVNHHDLAYEYENPFWEEAPQYPKMNEMESHLNGYNEKMEELFDERADCSEGHNKLKDIKNKFFNGGRYFRKDDLRIELESGFLCKEGVVFAKIDYLEKFKQGDGSSWKRWSGKIDLDRLVEYITNERLFEGLN